MKIRLPVEVGLMDDDFFALKWNADLLTRDLRTKVLFETETPLELLHELKSYGKIDAVLLDVEYNNQDLCLHDLVKTIKSIQPRSAIVCLSQYGEPEHFYTAIAAGTRGFLLKREVRMAIASALVQALQVDFLITPGILPLLCQNLGLSSRQYRDSVSRINAWLPNPSLTPKLQQVFTLRILYGMSSPLVAQEIHLAPTTVEKYTQYAYQKLSTQWGDEQYLAGVDLTEQAPEVQAFHRFNLPPKEKP